MADVTQFEGDEPQIVECLGIATQTCLILGTALEIVEHHAGQPPLRELAKVGDVDGRHGGLRGPRGFEDGSYAMSLQLAAASSTRRSKAGSDQARSMPFFRTALLGTLAEVHGRVTRISIDHQADHVAAGVVAGRIVGRLRDRDHRQIDVRVENAFLILWQVLDQRLAIGSKNHRVSTAGLSAVGIEQGVFSGVSHSMSNMSWPVMALA